MKIKSPFLSPLTFKNNYVKNCPHQRHVGIILDSKLDFNIHVDNKIGSFPRKAVLTIYKSFIKPHLDYGDILYDKAKNQNFQNKLESIQYKAYLVITGTIQGTSRQKNYDKLDLHTLIKM